MGNILPNFETKFIGIEMKKTLLALGLCFACIGYGCSKDDNPVGQNGIDLRSSFASNDYIMPLELGLVWTYGHVYKDGSVEFKKDTITKVQYHQTIRVNDEKLDSVSAILHDATIYLLSSQEGYVNANGILYYANFAVNNTVSEMFPMKYSDCKPNANNYTIISEQIDGYSSVVKRGGVYFAKGIGKVSADTNGYWTGHTPIIKLIKLEKVKL